MNRFTAERLDIGVAPLLRRVETPMPRLSREALAVAKQCEAARPSPEHGPLLKAINGLAEDHCFEHRLTRGGWYRPGGVVTADGGRVAEEIGSWAEREAEGDVLQLVARYGEADLRATRLTGRTHYFVAPTGEGPLDFLQLEVEELQEVVDRPLVPAGWTPHKMEDVVDPAEYPQLAPVPVGRPRYEFRRLFSAAVLLGDLKAGRYEPIPLERFVEDWQASSAGAVARFYNHWVLFVRETVDFYGDPTMHAMPVPTDDLPAMEVAEPPHGAALVELINGFDREAGYPFAWYFWMLTSRRVPHVLAEAVHRDLPGAHTHLPARDLEVLGHWSRQPYCV